MREQPSGEALTFQWYADFFEDAAFYTGQEREIGTERAVPKLAKAVAGSREVRFFVVHILDPDTLARALIEIALDHAAGEAVGIVSTKQEAVAVSVERAENTSIPKDVWADPIRFRSAPDFELALDRYLTILQERGDL